jgi:hypothetical protein
MEFRDLKKQYQVLKKDIDKAVTKVMSNANFISGQEVTQLEEQLAEYVGVKHCITCGNGTDALILALMAIGVGKGDAVFVPDFTFFASAEAPAVCGATPIFVDVDKDTFNISVNSLEEMIQETIKIGKIVPRVIIAVDLFGQPADFPKIRKIADKYGLLILEDAAQGFGGAINGKRACSFGDISTTSFFPAKPLGCYGDGGAVFTDNDEWADIIKSLQVHGKGKDKYDNVRIGMNSRLDTIQAAILQVKFNAFKEYELERVNEIANIYTEQLKNVVKVPKILDGFYSSWAQYTIKLSSKAERDALQKKLKEKNIPSMIYYKKTMHEQRCFSHCSFNYNLKNSTYLRTTVLSLPILLYALEDEQINIIYEILRK